MRHDDPLLRDARAASVSDPKRCAECLRRIDDEGIGGTLDARLVATTAPPEPRRSRARRSPAEWDAALAVLPADWSDLLCELELTSSDHIERGALLLAPLNPIQAHGPPRLPLPLRAHVRLRRVGRHGAPLPRAARRATASPARCAIVRALSDTHPVGTQGPVWYVGGKAV